MMRNSNTPKTIGLSDKQYDRNHWERSGIIKPTVFITVEQSLAQFKKKEKCAKCQICLELCISIMVLSTWTNVVGS